VAANFWNRIFNATNEKSCHGVKGPPGFLLGFGAGEAVFKKKSYVWCREWTVHCSLSTWTVDNQLSMQALWGVKSNSSQVPDMFPEEFTIGPHFYVWQMLGRRGRALYFKIEPSIWGSLHRFFFL
jgi:hypothetical protein